MVDLLKEHSPNSCTLLYRMQKEAFNEGGKMTEEESDRVQGMTRAFSELQAFYWTSQPFNNKYRLSYFVAETFSTPFTLVVLVFLIGKVRVSQSAVCLAVA